MIINRHNYEEFFLLYVDDELTAGERALVERFIEENPDVKVELELLQQATLEIDAKLDEDFKTSLLKPIEETDAVNQEQLMLLVDGELNDEEAARLKLTITANPNLQKELQWFQRSKLSADTSVVFPDKSLLYKEAQPARVFYLSTAVKRWSAAAAVIVMLGTGYWLMQQPDAVAPVANTQNPAPVQPKQQTATTLPSAKDEQAPTNNIVKEETKALPQLKTSVPALEKKSTPAPVQQQNNLAVINKPKQQEPSIQQPQQQLQSQEAIVKTDKNPGTNGNNLPTATVPLQPSIANASSVSYVNNNEDAGDENEQQGLLNENTQRSTGLKALIKKAKRTLERRTGIQSGESQVRFAVFAINTQ